MAVINLFSESLEASALDIVLVHGIDGDWEKTWRPKHQEADLPLWPVTMARTLTQEGISCRVFSVDYPARTRGESAPIYDQAAYTLPRLQRQVTANRLLFICHSLGGILVKKMLSVAHFDPHTADLLSRTAGILFLGTPHNGARSARLMRKARLASDTLKELQPDSAFLRELSDFFRPQAHIHNWQVRQFSEGRDTGWSKFKTRIVTKTSAYSGVGPPCVPALLDDHISLPKVDASHEVFQQALEMSRSIARPESVDPVNVSRLIRDVLQQMQGTP